MAVQIGGNSNRYVEDPSTLQVNDGDVAYADDVNNVVVTFNNALDLVEGEVDTYLATTSGYMATTSGYMVSAANSSTSAYNSSVLAASSAEDADNFADYAGAQAASAYAFAVSAGAFNTSASTFADNASTQATSASSFADLASGYSVSAYNSSVSAQGAVDSISYLIPPSGIGLTGHIVGLTLSNNVSGDASNDILVSKGVCYDSTGNSLITLSAAIVKRLDAEWASGSNAGGLLSGSVATGVSYNVYALQTSGNDYVDVGFLPISAAIISNLPTGYDKYRFLGFIRTHTSATSINLFHQTGASVTFESYIKIGDVSGTSNTAISLSSFLPSGYIENIGCSPLSSGQGIETHLGSTSGESEFNFETTDTTSTSKSRKVFCLQVVNNGIYGWVFDNTPDNIDLYIKSFKLIL